MSFGLSALTYCFNETTLYVHAVLKKKPRDLLELKEQVKSKGGKLGRVKKNPRSLSSLRHIYSLKSFGKRDFDSGIQHVTYHG